MRKEFKRKIVYLVVLCMSLTLFSCSNDYSESTYRVQLMSVVGSGYTWNYEVENEEIARVEIDSTTTDASLLGQLTYFNATIFPLSEGETTVHFNSKREWNDNVWYDIDVNVIVDSSFNITGETSLTTVTIDPNLENCVLSMSDSAVAISIDNPDGTYTFTPNSVGSTTLKFTSRINQETTVKTYYLDVIAGLIPKLNTEQLLNPDDAELDVDFDMNIPEGATELEDKEYDFARYIKFNYDGRDFLYVCGVFPMDTFNTIIAYGGEMVKVDNIDAIYGSQYDTILVWSDNGFSRYLATNGNISKEEISSVLKKMI